MHRVERYCVHVGEETEPHGWELTTIDMTRRHAHNPIFWSIFKGVCSIRPNDAYFCFWYCQAAERDGVVRVISRYICSAGIEVVRRRVAECRASARMIGCVMGLICISVAAVDPADTRVNQMDWISLKECLTVRLSQYPV